MYDLNKRSYISTLGELRELLAALPDDTEISGAGAFGAWLHFSKEKKLVCVDPEPLYDCYEEYDDEEVDAKEEEQMKEHESRLYNNDEGWQTLFVGHKLMRTFPVDDDTIDEEDRECFGRCWDYELYDVKLSCVDTGQLGKQGNMTREEIINTVFSWNNIETEERTYFPTTESIVALCETYEHPGDLK